MFDLTAGSEKVLLLMPTHAGRVETRLKLCVIRFVNYDSAWKDHYDQTYEMY